MSPIVRQENSERPLLERHQFIPNFAELALHTSVRVNTQIILENTLARRWKVVEVLDEFSDDAAEPLSPILKAQQNEFVGQPVFKILSGKAPDVDVDVENKKLENERDCDLVIVSKTIDRPEVGSSTYIYR